MEPLTNQCLLHICCAPCSVYCIEALRAEGWGVHGFWYNPNIHPLLEYQSRRDALRAYAEQIALPVLWRDEYGLRCFLEEVWPEVESRCESCYRMRLGETARLAAELGMDGFTTTLLVSPYQNHEHLIQTAESAAAKYGTRFLYRDFRPGFRAGQQQARELELYRQKYCGCIFSEEERYSRKKK